MKGQLYGFGRNEDGQLGMGNTTDYPEPSKIDFFDNHKILQIFTGECHSVVLTGW